MTKQYDRWKSKARALARLAEDQRGKPEGDLARQKLLEIINRHPEARDFGPIRSLAERDLTMRDIRFMRNVNISTDGRWTGANVMDAVRLMEADYKQRISDYFMREQWTSAPEQLEETVQ